MDISNSNGDRTKQLKAFDDTKSGVKGLVDAAAGGVVDIPQIFIRSPEEVAEDLQFTKTSLRVPAIDLTGVGDTSSCTRQKIVEQVKDASEKWGFFQVVNHGVPIEVLEAMLNGFHEFMEQDVEAKKEYYSRDPERMVKLNTNHDFFLSKSANWRDQVIIDMLYSDLNPQDLPSPCRNATVDFLNQVMELADTLLELLSEALGLEPNHLKQLECKKGRTVACNYYPPCPKPDQTLGATKHTDKCFITILLQDEVGGLQVLHQNQWADVEPIPGALVVNIGDFLQIVSNDKFKSVIHRAFGNTTRSRASVACFFHGVVTPPKIYGPIQSIITKESPQRFTEFTVQDYMKRFYSKAVDDKSDLDYVRI